MTMDPPNARAAERRAGIPSSGVLLRPELAFRGGPMRRVLSMAAVLCVTGAGAVPAQTFAGDEPVLRRIWEEGTQHSQLVPLAQALLDSIGPRLTGTPEQDAAHRWAVARFGEWGIPARNEQYGTWLGWRRGHTHIDLLEPRVRTLEGMTLAYSPGTQGPVTGPVVALPAAASRADFEAWLPQVQGRFVMISVPQPTCRPDDNWERWGEAETVNRMRAARTAALQEWNARLQATGVQVRDLPRRLEEAGALGVVTSLWSQGWGVNKIFNARTQRVPTVDLSCEDYGMLFRMTEANQGPVLRIDAGAELRGDVPAYNTIAEIRGRNPNEYVILSAHFDSWDGATGATDNGTGTIIMMEAMRILRQIYPTPRRTILAGLWGGEEHGLIGSRAFVADNPRIVEGVQVLLNQDNGTGRIAHISMQGFGRTGPFFERWLARVPTEISRHISLQQPGLPSSGGTDHASFVCARAPAFMLGSVSWDYGTYTWHTNRDTFDKIVFDEVRNNAILVAMLAYLAAEEPQRLPRDPAPGLRDPRTGQAITWPECQAPPRTAAESPRM
jgi:carboxypeptidase Q